MTLIPFGFDIWDLLRQYSILVIEHCVSETKTCLSGVRMKQKEKLGSHLKCYFCETFQPLFIHCYT